MSLFKALATVMGTSIGFGIVGTGIGALLGSFTPEFFLQLFPLQDPEHFNPVEFGIGMGLFSGLTWGLVTGLVVVAIISWKETQMSRKDFKGGDQI